TELEIFAGPLEIELTPQIIGPVRVGSAATRGDQVHVSKRFFLAVSAVMVPVAREDATELCPAPDRRADEAAQIFASAFLLLAAPGLPPCVRCAEDKAILLSHLYGNGAEVVYLAGVEQVVELDVSAPDPPVVWELDRKGAAVLAGLPIAEPHAALVG